MYSTLLSSWIDGDNSSLIDSNVENFSGDDDESEEPEQTKDVEDNEQILDLPSGGRIVRSGSAAGGSDYFFSVAANSDTSNPAIWIVIAIFVLIKISAYLYFCVFKAPKSNSNGDTQCTIERGQISVVAQTVEVSTVMVDLPASRPKTLDSHEHPPPSYSSLFPNS